MNHATLYTAITAVKSRAILDAFFTQQVAHCTKEYGTELKAPFISMDESDNKSFAVTSLYDKVVMGGDVVTGCTVWKPTNPEVNVYVAFSLIVQMLDTGAGEAFYAISFSSSPAMGTASTHLTFPVLSDQNHKGFVRAAMMSMRLLHKGFGIALDSYLNELDE